MYIKSIVIDGFKSYGQRTEINGFDKQFNAITGLNGSGKSNILDAICFVLGLQNLRQVRATLLQDLVYKQGQTGVTKASVTIIFDNNNKEQSPIGYENYSEITVTRQVIMGGKNKYLINGLNATNSKVKDLFCSVQLNVNNPHFLVMQGRITKVLNMKPMEILSMIEEAAGTRMFESKREQAERTLEKKDAKLTQIDEIINEDISPKLSKLKVEQEQYLIYRKTVRELEHLQKFYIAWRYVSCKQTTARADEEAERIKMFIQNQRDIFHSNQNEIEQINIQITELQKMKDSESEGKLNDTETELREKEKNLTKCIGLQKQNTENIQDEYKKIKQLEKNIKDDENMLKSRSVKLSSIDEVFHSYANAEERDKMELEKAQKNFQALSSGLVADDAGKEATLQDKLMESETAIAEAQTEIKQCELQQNYCKDNLVKKMSELQKTDSDFKKDNQKLQILEDKIKNLEKEVSSLNFDADKMDSIQEEYKVLKHDVRILKEKIDVVESKDTRLSFRYQNPEPNFNRKSVYGLVCKLIDVVDKQFATAIETTAGGRLFNVVVDNDVTSKKLLANGKLERRTTIIPINKISGRKIEKHVIATAEKLVGKDNVWSALSLIKYDPVLQPAMEYIFGTTFVCRDLNIAKKVCYHRDIMRKCVTLDGDTCDPSGTLSGGARQYNQSVLIKLQETKGYSNELEVKEMRIGEIETYLNEYLDKSKTYNELKQQIDLKNYELKLIRERLQQTTHYRYQEEVNELKQKIADFQKRQGDCREIIVRETAAVKEIQASILNSKVNRDRQLKASEALVKELKKKLEQSRKEREKRTDEYDSLKLEVEELKKSIDGNKEQIDNHLELIKEFEENGKILDAEVAKMEDEVKKLRKELKDVKESINKKNKEISQAVQKKDKLKRDCREIELRLKQGDQDLQKLQDQSNDCKNTVVELRRDHNWIEQEEQYFGQKNGIYDFKETNPNEAYKRISKLQETKDKLSRTINTKAMNLLAKTEEQYSDLMKRRQQVEDDKKKILEVISELGEKKKEALKQACIQVNKDFSSIFSTLLPGAVAKLMPPAGMSVLEGLEFRVGFGGKWKESLGELSGGQRSLVALSLILAMLLFNPAPIYILDEVDAALDLSHTQNIGNMLKSHFRTSQFIIVSLKDGMFNNANVLFRTRFIDGMSTVSKTVQNDSDD